MSVINIISLGFICIIYPILFQKYRKTKAMLRAKLNLNWCDIQMYRYERGLEIRRHGADYMGGLDITKLFDYEMYIEVLKARGFYTELETGLKRTPLKRLRLIQAFQHICMKDNHEIEAINKAFKDFPNYKNHFEKIRDFRQKQTKELRVKQIQFDAGKLEKKEKIVDTGKKRIDASFLKLMDKEVLLDWLIKHGPDPDFWHFILCNTDPDGSDKVYNWVVSQPECDAGTASQIFHYSNAFEALEYEPSNFPEPYKRIYQTAKIAADRWTKNDFLSHRFAPININCSTSETDFKRLEAQAVERFGEAAFKVSNGLFDASPRETPETDFFISDFSYP